MKEETTSSERLKMLKAKVREFPQHPGVYLMRAENSDVIYVGKAKNLRARVRSYFGSGDGRAQIEFLMRKVFEIESIVTASEEEASLLERDLIARYKPRYNIRLKDDKAYLSVRIDRNARWPRLELVRKIGQDSALYFGPYTSSYDLRNVLEIIKRVVPLRTCSDTVFYNRQRPCLEYQIKRCAAPCCLTVSEDDYQSWVDEAIAILEGNTSELETMLTDLMEQASQELRFEEAALYRDRLEALKNFRSGKSFAGDADESRDVFAIYREKRLAALIVLHVRNARVVDSSAFTFDSIEVSDGELLEAALSQFYEGSREVPPEIILPFEFDNLSLVRELIKSRRGAAVTLTVPKRGSKFHLLELAKLNARQHYANKFDAEERYLEVAKSLAALAKLKQVPRRIECVDISNLQGSDIVGAVVSFFDGQSDKSGYRRYKLSSAGAPDDFSAIHEVVARRLQRAQADEDLPDLLIIDGGPGQLSAALRARDTLGIDLDIIAIAKKRTSGAKRTSRSGNERLYIEGQPEPLVLDDSSALTHFLARVRDEVHRYVISFHRSRRTRRVVSSALDRVAGIGPERRRRLLKHFGSVEKMKRASPEELAKAGRMPRALALKLLSELKCT
ncbi:MAG: excinuclease ABC subunit UvrC [Candidatus Dadabacteria bacterium]|nr:MAG: excinuclease ABC subunit UvrC [Candidatus Dadabacteria bacterium]